MVVFLFLLEFFCSASCIGELFCSLQVLLLYFSAIGCNFIVVSIYFYFAQVDCFLLPLPFGLPQPAIPKCVFPGCHGMVVFVAVALFCCCHGVGIIVVVAAVLFCTARHFCCHSVSIFVVDVIVFFCIGKLFLFSFLFCSG